jgi:hypothetical protein
MPYPSSSRTSIYASRLFCRRRLDLRARLVAEHISGERVVIHARTYDVSRSGAGLTLTRELPLGTGVMLCLHVPQSDNPLCLKAIVIRRKGFRAGLHFVQPTAEQRLLLLELCGD